MQWDEVLKSWNDVAYTNKLLYSPEFLKQIPVPLWPKVLEDLKHGRLCADGPRACDQRTCGACENRLDLLEHGNKDEFGQYQGEENFGKKPLVSETGYAKMHGSCVDHECDFGAKDSPVVQNLAMSSVAEGKAIWGESYQVLPDGRHGPLKSSISNRADKARYLKASGHRETRAYN